ncbi:MAG: hypothetical protein HZC28_09040 [Spirochaetes bacterium]|nr:hypothetical protein [Spirochaetota bacterium]
MKKTLLVILFTGVVPLIFGSLFFNRNKKTLPEFNRNNPTDTKAVNYQKYESVDADGDGFPDFTVQLSLPSRTNVKVEIAGVHSGIVSNMAYTISGDLDVAAFVPFQNTFYVYNDQIESLTFKLKLKFKNGKVAPAVLKPFVATNQYPVASFFISNIDWTNKVFVATNSIDPDDTELYYAWDFDGGGIDTGFSTIASASNTYPSFGSNYVVLYVRDKFGYSNAVSNMCIRTNNPPVALFTISNVNWTNKIFDASTSYDPDNGATLTYAWDTNADGTADTSFIAGNKVFPFYFTTLGSNDIVLFVSDGIATNRSTNACLRTNAAPAALFTISNVNTTNKVFNASLSSDSDGSITGYAWDYDGVAGIDTPFTLANRIFTNFYQSFGQNTVTLYVKDQFETNTSSQVCIYTNTGPTASFTVTPSSGSTNTVFAFNASGSIDLEENIMSNQWDFNGDGTYEVSVSSNTYGTNFTNANTYQIILKVIDAGGLFSLKTNTVVVSAIDTSLILWNKLDSSSSFSNSEVGSNGWFIGNSSYYSFAAGKFNNGLQMTGYFDCANKAVFPGSVVSNKKQCIEFWYKKTGAWQSGAGADLFCQGVPGSPNQNIEGCISTGYSGNYELRFGYAGTHLYSSFYNSNFISNQNYHLAFVWDEDGIGGGSNKIRIYVDGVLVGATNYGVARNVELSQPFVVGDIHATSGWPEWCAQGVIDNLKIWNYAKTNFSDRFSE